MGRKRSDRGTLKDIGSRDLQGSTSKDSRELEGKLKVVKEKEGEQ